MGTKRYGMPYKGSKNSIAPWIVSQMPKAENFIDLFCGGCAVAHAAAVSMKYNHVYVNDIDERLPKLFRDSIDGKYSFDTHSAWIDRKTFFDRKDEDAYIALCWSFGNNGKDYLYGKDVEPFKRALHYAVFFDDYEPLKELDIEIPMITKTGIYDRYIEMEGFFNNRLVRTQQIENLERLVALERLQSLQSGDYQLVPILQNSVIYCDIPYKGTNCGKYVGFDHERFYKWAVEQDNIYISEYEMPEDFICIASIEKRQLSTALGSSDLINEKLFTNKRTYDKFSKDRKEQIQFDTAEQLSLFL